jgi:hypothetical protein
MTENIIAIRVCIACQLEYVPVSARQRVCKTCTPDKSWQSRYRRYGLTKPMFDKMWEEQDGKCVLCLYPLLKGLGELSGLLKDFFAIDHDHETGKIRGILCFSCNSALHKFEDPEYVARVFKYLNRIR